MIELLVLIAIAAVVLYRLKQVIGTRTGHEAPPEHLRQQHPNGEDTGRPVAMSGPVEVPSEDVEIASEEHGNALAAIRAVEPGFSVDEFLGGARGAYEMILMAYEEGDKATLQSLLAPDVFQAFEAGIDAREAEGLRVEARFIGVAQARVDGIEFDETSNIADVTIRFVGELVTAVYDAENKVVEGDPNDIRRQTDVWTFSREMGSVDPNWLLTGTGA